MADSVDVAVIGAGILGCMAARELTRYRLDVAVLERYGDVGDGSTTANSGLIHTGFHARAGTLKGLSCVEGNALYLGGLAEELGVPLIRCGGLFVAFKPEGLEKITEKVERAHANGAGDLKVIDGDAAREIEPRLSKRAIAAMVAPTTSVISPFSLIFATARNAMRNGARFEFNAEVERIERVRGKWRLFCRGGRELTTRFVLNCAGDEAAPLDAQVHPADLVVRPKVGQYLVFDKQGNDAIRHVLFQAGEDDERGTLITPTVDGNLLVGPTGDNMRDFRTNATTLTGVRHLRRVARKLIPDIDFSHVITSFSGARTNISNIEKGQKDFVLRVSAPGFASLLGIKNPGMTCAPALAKRAIALLANEGLKLADNPAFDAIEAPRIPYRQRLVPEQAKLLASEPSYSRVVCRCEHITEGDVRAELALPLPPKTLDGVKRRLRTGMGRCQGAYCTPRVVEQLARELGVFPQEIRSHEHGGYFVHRSVK
jgi:glycerol-3-phosphate dehydrogenase